MAGSRPAEPSDPEFIIVSRPDLLSLSSCIPANTLLRPVPPLLLGSWLLLLLLGLVLCCRVIGRVSCGNGCRVLVICDCTIAGLMRSARILGKITHVGAGLVITGGGDRLYIKKNPNKSLYGPSSTTVTFVMKKIKNAYLRSPYAP